MFGYYLMHERTVLGKESRGMQNTLRSSKCVRVHDILVGNRMQHFFLDFFVSLFQTSHFCAVFCPLMLVKWPSHLFLFSIPGGLFACLTPLLVSVFVSLSLTLSCVLSVGCQSEAEDDYEMRTQVRCWVGLHGPVRCIAQRIGGATSAITTTKT